MNSNEKDLKKYFKCQTDICYSSELYGSDIEEHGSKVLMLFAEIYSYMVGEFGLNLAPNIIIKFENSEIFKSWFWNVKHVLGYKLSKDPEFQDIGKWIGQGLFLKIVLSIINYNLVFLNDCVSNFNIETITKNVITKQRNIIDNLLISNHFVLNGRKAIDIFPDGYNLLNETVLLDYKNPLFNTINIIK